MTYVALAVRDYGQGRICLHTDRIGGRNTGHGQNPTSFWRSLIEWTSLKGESELITIGLINNIYGDIPSKLNDVKPVNIHNIDWSDLASINLDFFDLLYVIGLTENLSSDVSKRIAFFVQNGGGLVIESPNITGEINVLSDIESLYCQSKQRPTLERAYWTLNGSDHKLYTPSINVAFMSAMKESDFSSKWTLLMTDTKTVINTTTTSNYGGGIGVTGRSSSAFGIGYISSMQDGVVELKTDK